jgi:hypothetical protein
MRWAAALVLVCLLMVAAVSSAPAQRSDDSACTWGASSMTAEVVDGKVVESEPATTGCIPG